MKKLRYNKTFIRGLIAILFLFVLSGSVIIFFVFSKAQYNNLISGMEEIEATIVDIDLDVHYHGPNEQKIYITYEVDGVTYNRELKTDTQISFSPGRGAHYSVGDKIDIFYDPRNPQIIASPRSISVGIFYLVIGLFGIVLVAFALFYMLKNRRKFLVTQEEYDNETEQLKKSKLARKEQKQFKKKNSKYRKFLKVLLIIIASIICIFLIYHLFRGILRGITN